MQFVGYDMYILFITSITPEFLPIKIDWTRRVFLAIKFFNKYGKVI